MKSAKSRSSAVGDAYLIILMNIISLLYFLVNVQCVNENASKQYTVYCLDEKCTGKIADGRVNQLVAPENSDYLNANLNDSFDVLGLNKDVYLVRKQLKEGLLSKQCLEIVRDIHTPSTQVELSFKNHRIIVFGRRSTKPEEPQSIETKNTQPTDEQLSSTFQQQQEPNTSSPQSSTPQKSTEKTNQTHQKPVVEQDPLVALDQSLLQSVPIDVTSSNKNTSNVETSEESPKEKELDVKELSEEATALDQPNTESKTDLKSNEEIDDFNSEIKENQKILNEESDLQDEDELEKEEESNNATLYEDEHSTNDLAEEEEKQSDDRSSSINIISDSNHYVKMNSIESSTTDAPFNQAESSYFCTLPPKDQSTEMNFYLDILRSVLGKLVVDRLPEYVVTFLKIKLLVSVHLIVFILLIGIIWLISYFITFIYISIDNKAKLKNQLCELQAQLAAMKNEKQLTKKSGAQHREKEHEQERIELEKTIDDLLKEKLKVEMELGEMKSRVKSSEEINHEMQKEKERLMKDLKEEMLNKSKLELNLNERIKKLEEEQNALNNYCTDLKNRKQTYEIKLEAKIKELAELNGSLDVLREETKEKDKEIEYLNRMYEELKEQRADQPEERSKQEEDDHSIKVNHHDLSKLKHDIEKSQKERDEFRSSCEEYKSRISELEEEISKFEEYKTQLVNEKEEAERYTEFSKKYLREKEDELQVQMQSMRDELEQTKKLYLSSEKYSSDQWKENQALKNDLNLLRRDNEQLRKRIVEIMQGDQSMPMPPEMPQALLNYLRFATSPTQSLQPQPQSPSNQSQISDYYQQQAALSQTGGGGHSYTTSPTHSLTNLSFHSNHHHQYPAHQQTTDAKLNNNQTSPTSNYSYGYPQTPNSTNSNLNNQSIFSPTLHNNNEHSFSSSSRPN